MAFLGSHSFDDFDAALLPLNGFMYVTGVPTAMSTTDGRRGGGSLHLTGSGGVVNVTAFIPPVAPTGDTAVIAFAIKSSPLPGIFFYLVNGGTNHLTLTQSLGAIEIRVGTSLVATTATGIFVADTYVQFELKVVLHASSGTIELRVNGSTTPVATFTGNTTMLGTAWTHIAFASTSVGTTDICDLAVRDGSGTDNNDFGGDQRVDTQFCTGNGNSTDSTPSTGTNRGTTIDEAVPNTTDYNTIVAVGDKDTNVLANLTATGTAVLAMQIVISAMKTDAGVGSLKSVVRHSGTDYPYAVEAPIPAGAYGAANFLYGTLPDGSNAQILESDFNAFEVGYERTA